MLKRGHWWGKTVLEEGVEMTYLEEEDAVSLMVDAEVQTIQNSLDIIKTDGRGERP